MQAATSSGDPAPPALPPPPTTGGGVVVTRRDVRMSFMDEVAAVSRRPGPRCSFARLDLPPADAADLETVLADATIPASAIAKALQARAIPIKQQTVTRHRQRDCSCPPAQAAA